MSQTNSWSLRPARLADVPALVALINARYRLFTGEDSVTESELSGHWDNPRIVPERDMCVVAGPDVVGWAEVEPPGEPFVHAEGWLCVAPDAPSDETAWDLLLDWVEKRARDGTRQAQPDLRTSRAIDLDSLDDQRDWFGAGTYRWGVIEIAENPYQRFRLLGDGGTFTFVRGERCQ